MSKSKLWGCLLGAWLSIAATLVGVTLGSPYVTLGGILGGWATLLAGLGFIFEFIFYAD